MTKFLRPAIGLAVMLMLIPISARAQEQQAAQPTQCITLNEAVTTALTNNPSVAIAREQIVRSQAQIREATAQGLPQIGIDATYSRTKPVEAQLGGGGDTVQISPPFSTIFTGRISQAADITGRVGLGVIIAKRQTLIQEYGLSQTERAVILDVKNSYYNVLRSIAWRDVAQSAVTVAEERLRITRAGLEAGTLAAFDVRSAEVQVANLRQQLISATSAIDVSHAALANTMGINITRRFSVQTVTPEVKAPEVTTPQAIETAYASRPEVKVAQEGVELRRLVVSFTSREHLPTVGLFGQVERNLNPGVFGSSDNWRYGVSATWNIWQGGAVQARVRQAEADVRIAEDMLQQVRLGVGLDVQSAVIALNDAYQRITTAQASVALAEEALMLAQVRYQSGISTAVEVTSAESDLTQARTNQVNAVYDYETALARLQRATGQEPEAANNKSKEVGK